MATAGDRQDRRRWYRAPGARPGFVLAVLPVTLLGALLAGATLPVPVEVPVGVAGVLDALLVGDALLRNPPRRPGGPGPREPGTRP